jgi:hypothetical protein
MLALTALLAPSSLLAGWTFPFSLTLEGVCGGVSAPPLPPISPVIPDEGTCNLLRAQVDAVSATSCSDEGCCTAGYAVGACVFSPDTGGGTGSTDVDLQIPGTEFLTSGSLLGESRYEHLAGGFHSLGDVSLMSTGYGESFFSRHYTSSTDDWFAAARQRFQNYLDANRRHRERFGAGDAPERPGGRPPPGGATDRPGGRPADSPFGGRAGATPGTTARFDDAYLADLEASGFLTQLQMRNTGTGLAAGRYVTLEDMERQRFMRQTGASPVWDGVPVMVPERAEVTATDDKSLLQRLQDQLWDKAKGQAGEWKDSVLEGLQLKDVTDRVESASGILKPFVTDLAGIGLAGASEAAEAAAHGSPGQMAALERSLQERVDERAGQAQDEAEGFVWGEFKDNIGGALGELVEVDLAGDMTKAVWDAGTAAVEKGSAMADSLESGILEIQKRGGDLEAVRGVFKDALEDFAVEGAAEAAAAGVTQTGSSAADALTKTVFRAKDEDHSDTGLKPGVHPDEPRWPARKR